MDQQCRGSKGKVKIEGCMSISDEEAHQWLLHNMKNCHMPTQYIQLFNKMLTNRKTCLCFDNYISEPIQISNGTTQGCLVSMILYAYYNTDLIDIAKGKCKLSTGFVDDCMFVVIADTINEAHSVLKDIMERASSRLEWSLHHNSPFETTKLTILDFARTPHNIASSPLQITQTNPDNSLTTHTISMVDSYKYLGVVFDPELNW